MSQRSGNEAVRGEVVATPGAQKPHAAFVTQGTRILFIFPVDTLQEGQARIGETLVLLDELRGVSEFSSAEGSRCR